MQETLFQMTMALTFGVFAGFVAGLARKGILDKSARRKGAQDQIKTVGRLTYVMIFALLVLLVGLLWTAYCLILGLIDPAQTEYATNVSQLIVSVLTVFSIIVAFIEFWRRR